jgi:hypothetical protein
MARAVLYMATDIGVYSTEHDYRKLLELYEVQPPHVMPVPGTYPQMFVSNQRSAPGCCSPR